MMWQGTGRLWWGKGKDLFRGRAQVSISKSQVGGLCMEKIHQSYLEEEWEPDLHVHKSQPKVPRDMRASEFTNSIVHWPISLSSLVSRNHSWCGTIPVPCLWILAYLCADPRRFGSRCRWCTTGASWRGIQGKHCRCSGGECGSSHQGRSEGYSSEAVTSKNLHSLSHLLISTSPWDPHIWSFWGCRKKYLRKVCPQSFGSCWIIWSLSERFFHVFLSKTLTFRCWS